MIAGGEAVAVVICPLVAVAWTPLALVAMASTSSVTPLFVTLKVEPVATGLAKLFAELNHSYVSVSSAGVAVADAVSVWPTCGTPEMIGVVTVGSASSTSAVAELVSRMASPNRSVKLASTVMASPTLASVGVYVEEVPFCTGLPLANQV